MEQGFVCTSGNGNRFITFVRLWRKECGKEEAETITVYLWSTNLYEKYAPYIQEQLPDIITCCRFSLHDASPLKDSLMDLSTTNAAGAVYDAYISN